ncbi:MAG: molybdopterin molybdenumtransferase MoeA, partial [Cyanobacteria bacterium P01_H01_bin.130]
SPDAIAPQFVMATARSPLKGAGKRDNYLWGRLSCGASGFEFSGAIGPHQSANLINLAGTTGLVIVPAGVPALSEGEPVQVMMIQELH